MNILKAFLWTFTYVILINLAGIWSWPLEVLEIKWPLDYYRLIQGFIQLLVILILLLSVLKGPLNHYLKTAHRKWFYIAIPSGIAFVFLQSLLKWIYNLVFGTDYYITYDLDGLQYLNDPNLLATVLFIPIGEELFFRGYIQGKLLKSELPIVTITVSALLFALIHAPYEALFLTEFYEGWHSFYLTFFGGIFLGLLYNRTKSLLPTIAFHTTWNLMVSLI